jgi:hypothetical protein
VGVLKVEVRVARCGEYQTVFHSLPLTLLFLEHIGPALPEAETISVRFKELTRGEKDLAVTVL